MRRRHLLLVLALTVLLVPHREARAQSPETMGQWSAVMAWPIAPVHTILQPSGQILVWDRFNAGQPRIWNPSTNAFTTVPVGVDIFCAGHTALADGRTAVIGGHVEPCCQTGLSDTNLFDSVTRTWTRGAAMSASRWYPTATTLPDGRILATSGWSTPGRLADTPEVYDPGTDTWIALTAAARGNAMYSFMFVLPDGTVFEAGPGVVNGAGSTMTWRLDVNAQRWTAVGDSLITGGSAVMYAPGRVMKAGTLGDVDYRLPSVDARTVVIDMNQPSPAWREVAPMAFPRSYHTLTSLPDGTVVATGGERSTSGGNTGLAVYEAELWNPATETWTTLARMQRPRMYHSTAILLPDGRVLVSGGQLGTYLEANAEIYSPPYLFRGPRPSIVSVPQTLAYGTDFFVETPDASTITGASLVRLGATTHSFNQNQRYVALSFTQEATGLTVQAPTSGNLAPPGDYMLFILNANGVPSVARFVRFPSRATTTVNFDTSPPPGGPGPLDGVFQGIDFGTGQWAWEGPFDVGPTNNIYFADSTGTSRTFAFSPGPRILETLRVFTTSGGTLTLSDDAGQTLSQDVATGSMQRVTTGWTRPSATVTVNFTAGWALGVDDITYRTELSGPGQDTTPPVRANGRPSGTQPAGTTQTTLSLDTNENATCRYSTTPGVAYGAMTAAFATTGGTAHATAVGGLSNGGSYSFYVRCQDALGNANADDFIIAFSVATSVTTTTVNFDTPTPPGGQGPLDGVFQGIDFGAGQWAWEGPFDVDPTNHIYFANSTGTSRTFAFSPAPRVLQSLRVFSTRAGTLTLADDAGQTLSQPVATGSMQLVTTGWTRPSTTVTVSFTNGWDLGIDDIASSPVP